ncbi:MAG TPA: hypothetical protein VFS40_04735, partial [Gemmatimonadales bacterium]|nr:hypothetical protein [Gemmatimonadales bacterium]
NLGGNADIYRVSLAGGEPERLTTDPADDFAPDLSADGRAIAFHSWRAGSRDIYVMPLDGGPTQRVTSSPAQEWLPAWAPDDSALAFGVANSPGPLMIVRRHADGTWGAPVARLAAGAQWPAWSPDGRVLAYATDPEMLRSGLGVVPADSGAPRILIDTTQAAAPTVEQPLWSADGRWIYFKSHDARGNASLWAEPAGGGAPRLLVRFDDPARPSYRAAWALGRDRFYFTIEDRQSDVWVMDVASR